MVNRPRERLGPMPTGMGSASGIGTLYQKDRSGLQETFIFPVMGVVLVDIVQAILYYATIVASLYLLYRLTRRLVQGSIHPRLVRASLAGSFVRIPSQPDPVRMCTGAVSTGKGAWEVRDMMTAMRLLNHPAIGGDYLASLFAPLSPTQRDEFRFLQAWFREWPLFQEGPPQRKRHALLAGVFSQERIAALRPTVARIIAELLDDAKRESGGGTWDVMAQLAKPLPLRVVATVGARPLPRRPTALVHA
eukprot:Transcript_6730.p1 GENE.Transcript_6730~~Transcript_6730.p1  ORF type:complete len:248 (-),score=52.78 Transcript_6730:996-1739(-)